MLKDDKRSKEEKKKKSEKYEKPKLTRYSQPKRFFNVGGAAAPTLTVS